MELSVFMFSLSAISTASVFGSACFCRGGWTHTESCPTTDGKPRECILYDASVIIDTRIVSNVSCYYSSRELDTYDGPSGVYGYSGNTIWIYPGCKATEFEACIGFKTFCSNGLSTTVQCGIDDDPDDVEECAADKGNTITDVRVNKRLSNKECYYYSGDHTAYTEDTGVYGFSNTIIWAYRGCRAEFEICTVIGKQTSDFILYQPFTSDSTLELPSPASGVTARRSTRTKLASTDALKTNCFHTTVPTVSGYLPSRETDIRSFSTSQGTFHSTVTGNMASIPNDVKSFPTTQTTVHNAETGYTSSITTAIKSTATSQAAVTGYMSSTPTDVMSFSPPQVTIHRAVTGHMPSTPTDAKSSTTTQSTVHSSQEEYMQSPSTAFIGLSSTGATVHSTATGYMPSTPADVMSFPATQATFHIATIALLPSTSTDGYHSTSQTITGTTVQVAMYTGVTSQL